MTRKTPVKHHVKGHSREGHRVAGYTRGKGSASPIGQRRQKIHPDTKFNKPKAFTVNFYYDESKKDGETIVVISDSYEKALKEAYEEKVDSRTPVSLDVIDPDFGKILGAIGGGLKSFASFGGKFLVRGGHVAKEAMIRAKPHLQRTVKRGAIGARKYGIQGVKAGAGYAKKGAILTGKWAGQQAAGKYDNEVAKRLVNRCYSTDRASRTVARAELKEKFPVIYDVCDFSRT